MARPQRPPDHRLLPLSDAVMCWAVLGPSPAQEQTGPQPLLTPTETSHAGCGRMSVLTMEVAARRGPESVPVSILF